jgi:hypothetical protein
LEKPTGESRIENAAANGHLCGFGRGNDSVPRLALFWLCFLEALLMLKDFLALLFEKTIGGEGGSLEVFEEGPGFAR